MTVAISAGTLLGGTGVGNAMPNDVTCRESNFGEQSETQAEVCIWSSASIIQGMGKAIGPDVRSKARAYIQQLTDDGKNVSGPELAVKTVDVLEPGQELLTYVLSDPVPGKKYQAGFYFQPISCVESKGENLCHHTAISYLIRF
ncbi:hypothetical protein [Nocardia brasiliensis]